MKSKTRWEVEWQTDNEKNRAIWDDPKSDLALLDVEFRRFPNKGLALAFARNQAPKACEGNVWVRELRWDDESHDWESAEAEHDMEFHFSRATGEYKQTT